MYNSLVFMGEDRGLPEPSLDNGGTAELGGLKSGSERRLGTILCCVEYGESRTSFNLSNIWTVVSQSTHASVILIPYLSPEGPDTEKLISIKEESGGEGKSHHPRERLACQR